MNESIANRIKGIADEIKAASAKASFIHKDEAAEYLQGVLRAVVLRLEAETVVLRVEAETRAYTTAGDQLP